MGNPFVPSDDLQESSENYFDEMPATIGARIQYLRNKADLTQSQLADILEINQSNIGRWEAEKMAPRQAMVGKLATALNTNVNWLINGGEDMDSRKVPILGFVGAGAELYPVDDYAQGAAAEYIDPPFNVPDGAVAVTVRGDSMYPELDNGDVLIYRKEVDFHLEDCLNKRCIIQTVADQILVKRLRRGSASGAFNLVSVNAEPIENVRIKWASPILGVVYR